MCYSECGGRLSENYERGELISALGLRREP